MHCPICRAPLSENDAACPACNFSIQAADQLFGIPPQLERPIHDLSGTGLSRSKIKMIGSRVRQIERRFPQIEIGIVLCSSPEPSPLAAYTFWLFNRGSLFSALESAGENFGLLLLIDTDRFRACAMTGYGLEPLFADESLQACLNRTADPLSKGDTVAATIQFLATLDEHLESTHSHVHQALGLVDRDTWTPTLRARSDRPSHSDY